MKRLDAPSKIDYFDAEVSYKQWHIVSLYSSEDETDQFFRFSKLF